jgi:hypothetical protein
MRQFFQSLAKRCRMLAGLLAVVSMPALAIADPVQVTGGSIGLFPDGGSLHLTGPGLQIDVVAGMAGILGTNVIPVGRSVALDFDVMPIGFGLATVPGFTTPAGELVQFGGNLHFTTPPVFVPDPMTDGATFSFPFTMTGAISGFTRFANPSEPLFTTSIFGFGTTTFSGFTRFDAGSSPVYVAGAAVQTISFAESPVPEPTTLLLCASGVAVISRRVHRSRSAAKSSQS